MLPVMKLEGEARKLRKANLRIVPTCQSVKFPTIPIFRIKKAKTFINHPRIIANISIRLHYDYLGV